MKRSVISQREARRLRKRVEELETQRREQRSRWASDWGPGWVNILTLTLTPETFARIDTARRIKHAVIAVPEVSGTNVRFYADPL